MLAPLDTLPPWVPGTPTLGWTMLRWISDPARGRFVVPDGPRSGRPLVLTPRQILFYLWWYAIAPDGLWLMRGATKRHARGKGKSPEGALTGLCDFLGPARPILNPVTGVPREARPGELAGAPVSMPLVQVAAVSEAQTDNTWRYVMAWGGRGTPLEREFGLDVGKTMITSPTRGDVRGGTMRTVANSAATVRGSRPTLVVADELGEWMTSNGGVRFGAVIEDNATKVPYSRILGLANAWEPGSGSLAESLWNGWSVESDAVAAGEVEHPHLMDVLEAPADTDWSEEESIRAAIASIYHDAPWVDQRQVMSKIMDPRKPIAESQREYGNWRVAAADAWTSADEVERNRVDGAALVRGEAVVLGCDPADTDDATGLIACRMSDGLVEPLWFHDPHSSGRPTSFEELDDAVDNAFQLYDVVGFAADVNPAQHLVKTVWPQRYASRLLVPASPDGPVALDNRAHRLTMLRATEQASADLRAGTWPHTGHPILVAHLLNAYRRPSVGYVGVRKGDQTRKIDLAVAAIMARHMRSLVLESEAWADRGRESFAWVMG